MTLLVTPAEPLSGEHARSLLDRSLGNQAGGEVQHASLVKRNRTEKGTLGDRARKANEKEQTMPHARSGALLALGLLVMVAPVAADDIPVLYEDAKLVAVDGDFQDEFGTGVSLEGDRALVGAYQDDDVGEDSGSAYVFERDESGAWVEVAKLLASDGHEDQDFGIAVSLSGDRALVGAVWDDTQGENAGAAYVFERSGTGVWVEVAKLLGSASEEDDLFGLSVALSGDRALVGAELAAAVYVFEPDAAGQWSEVERIIAPPIAGHFGERVSLEGDRALIGAHASVFGSAFVYERDKSGNWVGVAKLEASDQAENDEFGFAVSLWGDRALVSAYHDDDRGSDSGSAYVFERNDQGEWEEVAKLLASDGNSKDRLGEAVSLWGDRALVGSKWDDDQGDRSGAVYVFERNRSGRWVEAAKLLNSDGESGDALGLSVSAWGNQALVGSDNSDGHEWNSGAAYVYTFEDCILKLGLDQHSVQAGDDLQIGLSLEHNRPATVTVPFRLWIEDAAGDTVASLKTPPLTFHHGDTLRQELVMRIPDGTPPGRYVVMVGVERMHQGIAAAVQPFQVVGPSAFRRPNELKIP